MSFSLQTLRTKLSEAREGPNVSLENLNKIIVRFINMQGFHIQFIGHGDKVICKALLTMTKEVLKKVGKKKMFNRTFTLKVGEKFTRFEFDSEACELWACCK